MEWIKVGAITGVNVALSTIFAILMIRIAKRERK